MSSAQFFPQITTLQEDTKASSSLDAGPNLDEHDEDAYYKRKSAIHECGHAIVARAYGYDSHPFIWQNLGPNRSQENLWRGRTLTQMPTKKFHCRRICLAGVVAQAMADLMAEPDESPDLKDLFWLIEEEELRFSRGDSWETSDGWSKTDWEGSQGWNSRDVRAVCTILYTNWDELLEEAQALMSKSCPGGFVGLVS